MKVENPKLKQLRNLVLSWAEHNKYDPAYAWGRLFGLISSVYHIDVIESAKTRNCRPLHVIECDGLIDQAIDLARGM